MRLSALSGHQVIWVATHDSIGLGEDGPTHQPVETAAHLRAMPNLDFWRPADGNETSAAYLVALKAKTTPSVISLSRQNLPQLENSTIEHAVKGGYVVHEVEGEALTIVSTGSEVSIALEAAGILSKEGIKTRVVSLPCWRIFDAQPEEYKLSILRSGAPVLSVEAYSVRLSNNVRVRCSSGYQTFGWERYAHESFGLAAWGASGPYQKVYEKFGITGSSKSKCLVLLCCFLIFCRHRYGWKEGRRLLQEEGWRDCLSSRQGVVDVKTTCGFFYNVEMK